MTRNLKRAVDLFHATHFDLPPFEPVLTREFLPYKVQTDMAGERR